MGKVTSRRRDPVAVKLGSKAYLRRESVATAGEEAVEVFSLLGSAQSAQWTYCGDHLA